ncbi:E3 ubiquitin-protein ligase RNF168-like isoform X2 [Vanessa cardui]|uniref:E3 ubiquitin-protein ligase RNF168-like isoform X2 n=1 Tax=Vanessa cardui TaxID=171605 RepID=UPI001F12D236|nr:E3 ubiquitin-protein ligase RNF168-like isoform X2 [Vanessa cardui]
MSKMAAKSKKRLSKIENKLLKLEKLELNDVICSICQSILIEPVTLPCNHDFCQSCFNKSIENNALCCPLCRLRIGSWLRTATKQKNLVNSQLWNFMKTKFIEQIDKKLKGEDISVSPETLLPRICEPGEIRSEYEAELKRLRVERLRLEQQEFSKTELLIKKIKEEEEEAHKRYLENIKQDEILAKQLQEESAKTTTVYKSPKRRTITVSLNKPRLRPTTIDSYLKKSSVQATIVNNPHLTDDNNSTDISTPIGSNKSNSRLSPEMLPSYGKLLKNFLDKKIKSGTKMWNKENGKSLQEEVRLGSCIKKKEQQVIDNSQDTTDEKNVVKTKIGIQSLLVSLPLPHSGILHKTSVPETCNIETSSVDSMQQELCYFKPIEGTTPTSFKTIKGLPLRVPCIRADKNNDTPLNETPPSRDQYIDGLCRLRNLSLAQNMPSAFVIVLELLKAKKHSLKKCSTYTRSRGKKSSSINLNHQELTLPSKRPNKSKRVEVDGITKLNDNTTTLRRTRSMGSISKDDNEVTPKKKFRERKFNSDRKPYLRSDSKRMHLNMDSYSPPSLSESLNNNKVDLAVKNLSSPLDNCDVKSILREQLRIEKIIEQEKKDLELALKIDAEWNGRRQPRRAAAKRPLALAHALRPAKKLKV